MPRVPLYSKKAFSLGDFVVGIFNLKSRSGDEITETSEIARRRKKINLNSITHHRRVLTTCVLISQIITLVSSEPVTKSCVFFGTIMQVIAPL